MPPTSRLRPREHVVSGEWPDAEVRDAAAEVARRFVVNLRAAADGRSLRVLETATGVDHDTIGRILRGLTWPDLATIARLERGLGVDLWPGRGES